MTDGPELKLNSIEQALGNERTAACRKRIEVVTMVEKTVWAVLGSEGEKQTGLGLCMGSKLPQEKNGRFPQKAGKTMRWRLFSTVLIPVCSCLIDFFQSRALLGVSTWTRQQMSNCERSPLDHQLTLGKDEQGLWKQTEKAP